MHRTIFTTPVVCSLLRGISQIYMKLAGWKVEGLRPAESEKCVLIAAPHTSNWDLPFTLMVAFLLRLNLYWLGKASIFQAPFGGFMRWLGGIPVDRSKSSNLVAESAKALIEAEGAVHLTIPPEGTRSKVRYWTRLGEHLWPQFRDTADDGGFCLAMFLCSGASDRAMEAAQAAAHRSRWWARAKIA